MKRSTEIKERPILFSGEMVRAILEGRKTQTRRVLKSQPNVDIDTVDHWHFGVYGTNYGGKPFGKPGCFVPLNSMGGIATKAFHEHHVACPYGRPGDRLWVRETWAMNIPPSGPIYRADAEAHNGFPDRWHPSIFMPRKFSRLALEITKARVERVQEISHADATAEGCRPYCVAFDKLPAQEYRELWDKINAKRGFGWDVNPWVWVIEFRLTNSK